MFTNAINNLFLFVSIGLADPPKFAEPIPNVTVALGRDATLSCVVYNLGIYKVSGKFFLPLNNIFHNTSKA